MPSIRSWKEFKTSYVYFFKQTAQQDDTYGKRTDWPGQDPQDQAGNTPHVLLFVLPPIDQDLDTGTEVEVEQDNYFVLDQGPQFKTR